MPRLRLGAASPKSSKKKVSIWLKSYQRFDKLSASLDQRYVLRMALVVLRVSKWRWRIL
jgi:hypothetical protein